MKQMINMLVLILLISFGMMYWISYLNHSEGYAGGKTLTIYNWGDYIDPELIRKFEQETKTKVIYQTFDSNEAMMMKIKQGGATFDVAVPSDYAIEKMREENLLSPIDHKKLPNLDQVDKRFMNLKFDPQNQYSVPYFWGTVGIIYNQKLLPGIKFKKWKDLWSPNLTNKILLVDGAREVLGFGLTRLGYSVNDRNKEHLQHALTELRKLIPNVKAIVGDEIKMLLASGDGEIGVVWSGDAAEIINENKNLTYVIPKDGSNLWFDNMVIPKTAHNREGAHKFINFMLNPENAAKNAEYVGYSIPSETARKLLPIKKANDARFYPPDAITRNLEIYTNLGPKMLSYYNELFLQFKFFRK